MPHHNSARPSQQLSQRVRRSAPSPAAASTHNQRALTSMATAAPAPTTAAAPRDVDALDALPDRQILQQDQEYLARHLLDKLFSGLMLQVLTQKPADPLQFLIDAMTLSPEEAAQDPDTGLPQHRKAKLLQVFKVIDKDGSGRISLRMLQAFASKHGGETLTLQDLAGLFADFRPSAESHISEADFLRFFATASATASNREFDEMIREMQG